MLQMGIQTTMLYYILHKVMCSIQVILILMDAILYIDLNSSGGVNGDIEAVKKGLMLIDEDTKIIPGTVTFLI